MTATPPAPAPRATRLVVVFSSLVAAAVVLAFLGRRDEAGIAASLFGAEFPFAYVLFSLVLLGVAMFHHQALLVALGGALIVTLYTVLLAPGFEWPKDQSHPGLWGHFVHEAQHTLVNLGGLLVGFALLAKSFEESHVPLYIPRLLPRRPWASAFALLAIVWTMSAFLDNIAAAMIGGVLARSLFRGRVTVSFLAALVAASNAGGAWSVLGDTTTTMMWIEDVKAPVLFPAIIASVVALLVLGAFAPGRQNRVQAIEVHVGGDLPRVDGVRLGIVAGILVGAVATNVLLDRPWIGAWAGILLGALVRRPAWGEVPGAAKGAAFLLSLVWCASLMPVKALPDPSWSTTFGLGFVSAVFDNIPLTKLALDQRGYDWALLAYAVGFGGSMIWFGSSAGVAISKDFPEARSTLRWLRDAWFVPLAYVLGFFAMLAVLGWNPE